MAKQIGFIKLILEAGKANDKNLAAALGQKSVNLKKFSDMWAEKSKGLTGKLRLNVLLFDDKSFDIVCSPTEQMTTIIKRVLGVELGSKTPGRETVKNMDLQQVQEIAKQKFSDYNESSEKVKKSYHELVKGTARSMGIKYQGEI
jgi:large subunit ribosomal protein L11